MAELDDRKLPQMPRFENEGDEARWWFEHREELGQDMVAAAREGKLGVGTARRISEAAARNETAAAWLDPADAEFVRRQAVSHGMEYESYLRMIVHRAVEEEKKRA
jgi:hypothetical protein